jgi:hypothetical protein
MEREDGYFHWGDDAKIIIESRNGTSRPIEIYLDEVHVQVARNLENPLADIVIIRGQLAPLHYIQSATNDRKSLKYV